MKFFISQHLQTVNMVILQNFEVVFSEFDVNRICT